MCFYSDTDWYASVVEATDAIADKQFRCQECGESVQAGENYHRVWQQEREGCKRCEEAACECVDWDSVDAPDDHECRCEEPDFGESYLYRTCHNCRKFLEAVAKHERDEGCRADESRPSMGDMIDSLREFDAEHLSGYFSEASTMYPELCQSGYLERLKNQVCGRDD